MPPVLPEMCLDLLNCQEGSSATYWLVVSAVAAADKDSFVLDVASGETWHVHSALMRRHRAAHRQASYCPSWALLE